MSTSEGDTGLLAALKREAGLDAPPTTREEPDRGAARALASATIVLTGVALLVPNATVLLSVPASGIGTVLSLLGTVISAGLAGTGYALYRSNFTNRNAIRVAVWNALGVVVLGSVMVGLFVYQSSVDGVVRNAQFTIANLLAIGAAAHVIIGLYDARRVRAEELAAERRKLAVLNRVLRHNLRNEATILLGHADVVAEADDFETVRASAATLQAHAEIIGDLATEADTVVDIYDRGGSEVTERDLAPAVDAAVDTVREREPDADIDVDIADSASVRADPALDQAVEELVENGVVHGQGRVEVTAEAAGDEVVLTVRDEGEGVPVEEREVLAGDHEITQLSHGSGLGLWVVTAVAEASGGRVTFGDEGEAAVSLHLPAA